MGYGNNLHHYESWAASSLDQRQPEPPRIYDRPMITVPDSKKPVPNAGCSTFKGLVKALVSARIFGNG